jgi:hypothetical protein
MTALPYNHTDGGRHAAMYVENEIEPRVNKGDCVTRAIAIATGTPYAEVYEDIKYLCDTEEPIRYEKKSDVNNGVNNRIWAPYVEEYFNVASSYKSPAMFDVTDVGEQPINDCGHFHLDADEFSEGTFIVEIWGHLLAIIDGVLHDSWDSNGNYKHSSKRTQCEGRHIVFGWWKIERT